MGEPAHLHRAFIRGSAEDVWDALTNPAKTVQYFYGTEVESTWEQGARLTYRSPDGRVAAEGHIVAVDRAEMIEFTFHPMWDSVLAAEGPARQVWTMRGKGEMVELRIAIFEVGERTSESFAEELPQLVARLKGVVESGEPLSQS